MVQWTAPREGYTRLGREFTPEYRGYVINVSDTAHEDWYVYAWNAVPGTHAWLTRTDTEAAAREILEIWTGVTPSGFLCEVYVNGKVGHCPNDATVARIAEVTEDAGKRRRILECTMHAGRTEAGVRLVIPEYRRRWELGSVDSGINGGRLGPYRAGEPTWYVLVDNTCQGPFVRATLRRSLAATEPVWAGAEYVYAARTLVNFLPDSGPWYLSRTELHTIRQALARRQATGSWCPGTGPHDARRDIADRITAASEHAIRRAQQL